MDIITIHVDDVKAYVILSNGDRIDVLTDENAVHIHKNFNANSKIADIQHDLALYLELPQHSLIIKSILNIINSHK